MPKIFERVDGVVYSREFGQDPKSRVAVEHDKSVYQNPIFGYPWVEILVAAENNTTLQDALIKAVMIYELTLTRNEQQT